jgi:5'-nucleotidase
VYRSEYCARTHPRGQPCYRIGKEAPAGVAEDGTGVAVLAGGHVSVTPLVMDMAAHHLRDELQGCELQL